MPKVAMEKCAVPYQRYDREEEFTPEQIDMINRLTVQRDRLVESIDLLKIQLAAADERLIRARIKRALVHELMDGRSTCYINQIMKDIFEYLKEFFHKLLN